MSTGKNDDEARINYLKTLSSLRARRFEIDWQISTITKAAVNEGATWREVGEALGCSGQAAWSRFAKDPPPKIMPGQGPYHIDGKE